MNNKSITNIMKNAINSIDEMERKKATKSTKYSENNEETSKEPYYNVKQLSCRNCGGTLIYDADRDVVKCPYCGSGSIVIESDHVRIEKYKAKAKKDISYKKIDSAKEISFKELEIKKEINDDRTETILCIVCCITIIVLFITFYSRLL